MSLELIFLFICLTAYTICLSIKKLCFFRAISLCFILCLEKQRLFLLQHKPIGRYNGRGASLHLTDKDSVMSEVEIDFCVACR